MDRNGMVDQRRAARLAAIRQLRERRQAAIAASRKGGGELESSDPGAGGAAGFRGTRSGLQRAVPAGAARNLSALYAGNGNPAGASALSPRSAATGYPGSFTPEQLMAGLDSRYPASPDQMAGLGSRYPVSPEQLMAGLGSRYPASPEELAAGLGPRYPVSPDQMSGLDSRYPVSPEQLMAGLGSRYLASPGQISASGLVTPEPATPGQLAAMGFIRSSPEDMAAAINAARNPGIPYPGTPYPGGPTPEGAAWERDRYFLPPSAQNPGSPYPVSPTPEGMAPGMDRYPLRQSVQNLGTPYPVSPTPEGMAPGMDRYSLRQLAQNPGGPYPGDPTPERMTPGMDRYSLRQLAQNSSASYPGGPTPEGMAPGMDRSLRQSAQNPGSPYPGGPTPEGMAPGMDRYSLRQLAQNPGAPFPGGVTAEGMAPGMDRYSLRQSAENPGAPYPVSPTPEGMAPGMDRSLRQLAENPDAPNPNGLTPEGALSGRDPYSLGQSDISPSALQQPEGPPSPVGIHGPITQSSIDTAIETFRRYKSGKAALEARIISNERWFQLRHWDEMRQKDANPADPEPASAWLLNSIANKHADAMDNFPEASVLPREQGDAADAEVLSAILPVVLEQNGYEQTYSDAWWYKLKMGASVQGVFWDSALANGLGDIRVAMIDALNLYWEPGVRDLQASRNLFTTEIWDDDVLVERYPFLQDKRFGPIVDAPRYASDERMDMTGKSVVIDWYYKRAIGTKRVLHYAKFVGRELLYASENDPRYAQEGFYAHGKYPFVMDSLFKDESSPFGFGYIDVCKDPQMYIDKLGQAMLKHALLAARPRFFVKNNGGVNETEYADAARDFVHFEGGNPGESIMQVRVDALPGSYISLMNLKVDELKETSGNRDFSQGGTTSGVTAASAIAALQEAGSKLSRDMIKASYRAFTEVNYLALELVRQFYTEPRSFRILGEQGTQRFVAYANQRIQMQQQGQAAAEDGYRLPIFDIKVRAHRANPFSRIAQNELALGFFQRGFFSPQMADQALACIDMMDFEGKDQMIFKLSQNAALGKLAQQMLAQMTQMATIIDQAQGTQLAATIQQQYLPRISQLAPAGAAAPMPDIMQALGAQQQGGSQADKARRRAASAAEPQ